MSILTMKNFAPQISDNFVDAIDNFEEQEHEQLNIEEEKNSSNIIQHDDGAQLKKQLKEVNVILKLALNNEFAKALELCAER